MNSKYRDLSKLWWLWLAVTPLAVLLVAGAIQGTTNLLWYNNLTYKEGPVEWLAVLVCLVGAGLALVAHTRRKAMPTKWLKFFPIIFFAGFIFMAGEESSWGQHILNPRLPGQSEEVKNNGLANIDPREQNNLTDVERLAVQSQLNWLQRNNDQSETNFHNLPGFWGDLFGKLPKQFVEYGSLIGCVIIPLFFVRKLKLDDVNNPAYWFWPTRVCAVAAMIAFLLPWPKRIVELFVEKAPTVLRLSEPQELYLAIVLAIYIGSMAVRLKQHAKAQQAGQITTDQTAASASHTADAETSQGKTAQA